MTGARRSAAGRPLAAAVAVLSTALAASGPTAAAAVQPGTALEARPLRGLRAEIATLIVQGVEGGALPLAALALPERATPSPEEGGRLRLPVVIEVPGAPLLREGGADSAAGGAGTAAGLALEIYLYAVDGEGAVAAHLAREVELDLEVLGERLFETGLKLVDEIELAPGEYSLRAVVFEPASLRFGMRIEPLELRADGKEPGRERLRLPEACPSWLVAGGGAGGAELPSARPVLVAGESVAATLVPGADPAGLTAALRRRARAAAAGAAAEPPVEIALLPEGGAAGSGGDAGVGLTFTAPDLPQGIYELSLTGGAVGTPAPAAAQEVWLVRGEALDGPPAAGAGGRRRGCDVAWSAILRRAGGDRARAERVLAAARQPPPPPRGEVKRVRAAYRGVLEALGASGDLAAAAAELGRIEEELAGAGYRGLRALRRGELEEARELSAREGAIALPLLLLHQEAYTEHFRRRRFALATHSREVVSELADWLVGQPEGGDERALLADVLTSLAEHADRHRMFMLAQLLLERAVELDSERRAARLLLAISYERLGRYDGAVGQLERLVALDARNHEARLRLAVLLERTGRGDAAEPILRALVRERPADWVLSLALQTLARHLVDRDRPAEAAAVLERGLARLPGDERLRLQLAWTLDRAGRPAEATALIAGMPAGAGAAGPSPRLVYAESAAAALVPVREALARGLTARLPLLARALRAEPGRGPAP